MDSFGKRLKEQRVKKGITLKQMADDLKTTEATLSRYENDLNQPKLDFLGEIAEYLNVSTDYLLCKSDKEHGISKSSLPPIIQELIKEFQIQDIEALSYAKEKGLTADDIKAIVDTFEQLRPILTKIDK